MKRFAGTTLAEYLSSIEKPSDTSLTKFLNNSGVDDTIGNSATTNMFTNSLTDTIRDTFKKDKNTNENFFIDKIGTNDPIDKAYNTSLNKHMGDYLSSFIGTFNTSDRVNEQSKAIINNTSKGLDIEGNSTDITRHLNQLLDVESAGDYNAHRKGSSFYGGYQFSFSEAKRHLDKLGVTWADYKRSADIQNEVAKLSTIDHSERFKRVGIEPTSFNLWLAHNQGFKGALDILSNKISAKRLRNIRNQAGMNKDSTVQDYIAYYSKKFN